MDKDKISECVEKGKVIEEKVCNCPDSIGYGTCSKCGGFYGRGKVIEGILVDKLRITKYGGRHIIGFDEASDEIKKAFLEVLPQEKISYSPAYCEGYNSCRTEFIKAVEGL